MANQKTTTEQLQKEIHHKFSQCVELKESLGIARYFLYRTLEVRILSFSLCRHSGKRVTEFKTGE